MAASPEDFIPKLEEILTQFFDPVVAGDAKRKREIENQLQELKNRSDCWNIAHKCIKLSQNPTVLWFAVSMIDHIYRKKWSQLQPAQRATIREFLFQFLCARHYHLPDFVSNSLSNLIVRIAISDWPQEDSNFLTKTLNTLKDPATCMTGLLLFRQMADEFAPNNIKLLPGQKEIAVQNTKKHLPVILNTLRAFLEHQFMFVKDSTFTSAEHKKHSLLALEALLQFLGWITMNDVLNPELMDVLFKFVHLHNDETSLVAFSCINEILGQNFVPKAFSEFMVNIFNQLFNLLQAITKSSEGLNNYDEEYVDKFTRFTSLFVSQHLRRVENNPSFPIIEFLSLLFRYTFMQTSLEGFLSCLEIWETFLDYIISKQEGGGSPSSLHQRYEHGLASLGRELIQKIQYQTNSNLLSSLDTESSSEELDDSELESYVSSCLNIIGKIAQLYPTKILEVLSTLVDRAKAFLQVHTALERSLPIVKDAEILLRIFSQTACSFNYVDASSGTPLLNLFVQMSNYIRHHGLQEKHQAFVRVEAQVFGTLRAFTIWIQNNVGSSSETVATLSAIVELVSSTLSRDHAVIVGKAACVLLGSLGKALPMIQLPVVQQLLTKAPGFIRNLSMEVQTSFCTAMLCILLVPMGDKDANWDHRFAQAKEIIQIPIIDPYLAYLRDPQFIESGRFASEEAIQKVKHVTRLCHSMFQQVFPMEKRSKQIVYALTKDVIQATLSLFRTYLQQASVLKEILKFFLELYSSLRAEVGTTFAQLTIGTFMEILKGDKIAELFASNRDSEIEVVEQFFALLNILMSFPGSTFQSYVPHILLLTVEIYPHVADKEGYIGVKEAIFQVLYMILLTHGSSCRDSELRTVMEAFIYSFQHLSDLSVFKKNIRFLQDLNKRVKLFSKEFFILSWRTTFLEAFFKILCEGMHKILEDEIIPVVYELAAVDMNSFFVQILPALISALPGIHSTQKADLLLEFSRDTDMPTFTYNMTQMLETYRYLTKPQ